MNTTQPGHPPADNLVRLRLGQLSETDSQVVEAHLASCASCRGVLEALRADSGGTLPGAFAPAEVGPDSLPSGAEAATLAAIPGSHPASAGMHEDGAGHLPAELAAHPRYRLLEMLGAGGMGAVYRARHLLMERDVALKVINPALVGSSTMVERFRREVKTAARLTHPNIVTAHDAEQAGDWHFLVMEYVPGISLARLVAEKGRLSVTEACDYARQVALGLEHANASGMVHRDIKPQNLMLTPAGQVKILDFGLSRLGNEESSGLTATGAAEQGGLAAGSLTQAGCVMGTPDYIAPEQARDAHSADIRADIYSLGCTLYHLLAGKPPFPNGTDFDKVLAHLDRAPRPLQEIRPEAPAKLAAVVARMLAKSPDQRYQTPAEVATALAPFAGAAPVRRRRWPWALAALVLLAAGLTVAALAFKSPRDEQGEVVVETPERSGFLVFQQDGRRVVLDLQNLASIKLDPGAYDLSLTNHRDYLYLPVERCEVATGEKTTVSVRKVAVVREFRVSKGDIGNFMCVAFTPDGRRMLSGGHDNTLRLWDVATGKELLAFPKHPVNHVYALAVSPDGHSVAWGAGPLLILSDVETTTEIASFKGHQGTLLAVAFSPDSTRLLSGATDRTMRLWDIKSRQQLGDPFSLVATHRGNPVCGDVWSVAFTPDGLHALSGRFVVYGGHVPLQLWDLQDGLEEHRLDESRGTFMQHVAVISADGRRVLAGCQEKMILWNLETGKKLMSFLGHKGRVCSVAFLPDGRHVLSGGDDGTARVWDVATGHQVYSFTGHQGAIQAVAVAPDGCHALTAGADKVIRLWRMPVPDPIARTPETSGDLEVVTPENTGLLVIKQGGRRVRALNLKTERFCKLDVGDYDLELTGGSDAFCLLADRCHIAPGAKATIRIDLKVVGVYKGITVGGGVCIALTPDGKRVLAGGWSNPLRMWDVATRKELPAFACPGPPPNVFAVAVSPDGSSVAWGAGPHVRLSDLKTGKEIRLFKGHTPTVWSVAFSPKGTRLLSVGDDGTMRLWEVKSGKQLDVFRLGQRLTSVAFTPDGQHALVSLGAHVKGQAPLQLWDLQRRRDEHRLDDSRGMGQFCVATLSRDGSRVLAGSQDKMMRLWDLKTGKELKRFSGHTSTVRNAAFLPDGRVLSVSYDGTARIWDAKSGRQLYNFTRHRGQVKGAAIDPEGRHAFTVDGHGLVIRWRVPDPPPQR